MNTENVIQMKLANGEEIIGIYTNLGEEAEEMSLTHVLTMTPIELEFDDADSERSYYILRPFISYIDDLANAVGINPSQVIALTRPSASVVEQYVLSVEQIQTSLGKGEAAQASPASAPDSNVVSLRPKQVLTED